MEACADIHIHTFTCAVTRVPARFVLRTGGMNLVTCTLLLFFVALRGTCHVMIRAFDAFVMRSTTSVNRNYGSWRGEEFFFHFRSSKIDDLLRSLRWFEYFNLFFVPLLFILRKGTREILLLSQSTVFLIKI